MRHQTTINIFARDNEIERRLDNVRLLFKVEKYYILFDGNDLSLTEINHNGATLSCPVAELHCTADNPVRFVFESIVDACAPDYPFVPENFPDYYLKKERFHFDYDLELAKDEEKSLADATAIELYYSGMGTLEIFADKRRIDYINAVICKFGIDKTEIQIHLI